MQPSTLITAVLADEEALTPCLNDLSRAGYGPEKVSLVCSDQTVTEKFGSYVNEYPAGESTAESATAGGLVGGIIGGVGAAGLVTAGGASLLVFGPALLLGGAVAGTFLGAMQSRGVEGELADYYDQALTRGEVLLAVDEIHTQRRERVATILRKHSARVFPLPKEV